ncbi:type I secretion system permease/ATPase [Ferrimonas senticii]|uniref:type I secretion system permease/ATPase n=1 Tax=Ferrimonas senticii TaxID=394566 RepID=UPI00041E546D|nr:type I secretion system permease/ATPase [Ferrimonas senticii]
MSQGAFGRTLMLGRRYLLMAVAISFFTSLLLLTLPIYTLQLFNRVMISHSVASLVALMAIALFLLAVQSLLDFSRSQLLQQTGHKLDLELTPPLLLSAVDDSARQGKVSRKGLADLAELKTFFLSPASAAALELPWTPLFLLVLYLLHPSFAMVAALGATILLLLTALTYRISRTLLNDVASSANESQERLTDYLKRSHIIKSMGMGPSLSLLWRDRNGQQVADNWQLSSRMSVLAGISRAIRQSIQILLLALGVYLVMQQQVGPGAVIAASMLSGRFFAPIEPALTQWRHWQGVYQAYRRLAEYGAAVDAQEGKLPLQRPSGELLVNNVSYIPAGQKLPLLKQIGFRLSSGKSLAILGGSGEGKSTLLHLLLGMDKPSAGEIRIDGASLNQWESETLGQYIGYLPQEIELINGTVAQNIGRFGEANDELILLAAQLAGVHELVTQLPQGYETRIGDAGMQLSAGQRQRIALARALYGSPQLLVLDEPAANLDPAGERALIDALSHCRRVGITVVMVTHAPQLLAQVDWVLALKNGAIAQAGPKEQVLAAKPAAATATAVSATSSNVQGELL